MNPDLTIVLLGNSGVGKSASGNTILGRPVFDSRQSFRPVTRRISEATADVFGKLISVVDTPGIFDAEEDIKTWCQELLQSSRPCLFLVVFSVGRFTKEQVKVLQAANRVFGPQGLKNCYLLFTGGDALQDKSLEDFVHGYECPLIITAFSGRCHLFNNENGGQEQVSELLEKSGHLKTQQPPGPPADASRNRRIVLLGVTGGGKSSSGNTILGSQRFTSGCDFDSVSTETVSGSATVEGRQVTVVDTPGFTDELLSPEQLCLEIMKSIVEASPGPHAFIIVVRLGGITTADVKMFELLPKLFDRDALQYSMVLFTHGDQLGSRSIEDLIQSNRYVSDLVSMCSGRFCVFNNKASRRREQVRDLLHQIDEMVTANEGQHYRDEMFRMAEKFFKEQRNLSGETAAETGGETAAETGGETAAETEGETAAETEGETAAETEGETAAETGGETAAETGGETEGETSGVREVQKIWERIKSCSIFQKRFWAGVAALIRARVGGEGGAGLVDKKRIEDL